MATVVLHDEHVGKRNAASVGHEGVHAPGDRFVGDHRGQWMALGHLGGLGARSSAEIDHDVDVVHGQHLHGEHGRGLLARDAAGLVQMGQQGPRLAFGMTAREGHGEGLMKADPRHPFAADGLDLVDGPRRILAVGRDAKGLRERVFDHVQPCIEVGAE